MNKSGRILISAIVLAMIAFSAATTLQTHANTNLINPNTLTIAGSSTLYPVAVEEASQFPTYWNNLVAANPQWGASPITAPISITGLGSGTAIPALIGGTADVGEMSRPPQSSSAEWLNANMTDLQIWAVGIDSVAIVLSPDMTWFPTNLTTLQVAELFADTPASNYTTPFYTTWGGFLTDYYGNLSMPIPSYITTAELNEPINRAVRDPTSGTFDCFNNYFAVPNNFQFELKVSGVVTNSQEMAPYTYCEENLNIYNTVSAGTLATDTDYIGFISMGYLQTYGHMIGLNIAFNMANPPSSTIKYTTPYSWGPYVTPNRANVIYGVSGVQGVGATGQYMAWRWLWEVTPQQIPSTGPLLEEGVWIAYMRMPGTTILNGTSSDFINDQSYIELSPADIAGGQVIDSNLNPYTPLAGQTQSIPTGKVSGTDFFYFVDAYIHYYANGIYNPYCDLNADGTINGADFLSFASAYVAYFTSYNPTL